MSQPRPEGIAARQRVREADAAALLVDARRNRFLQPFLARACGVSQAARELGTSRSLVSYWVARLRAAGLLLPMDEGAGRQRAYRASADVFVVSLEEVPMESDGAILDAQVDPAFSRMKQAILRAARRHAAQWQFLIQRTPKGVAQHIGPVSGSLREARIVNQRGTLHLSEADAARMRDEMDALFARYVERSDQKTHRRPTLVWMCAVEDLP